MNKKICLTLLAMTTFALLAGCATTNTNPQVYSQRQAMRANQTQIGVVVMMRKVSIKNERRTNTGTAIGSAIGLGASQAIHNRHARNIGRIAGTAIGGILGTEAGRAVGSRQGVEVFVQLPNKRNKVISVVQNDVEDLQVGDDVVLVGRGNDLRVVRIK